MPRHAPSTLLHRQLTAALEAVYMSHTSFLMVFNETPAQAIAAFRKAPEIFGTVRTYVGPVTLRNNMARVIKLAEQLRLLSDHANH